jgi:hypothetical protein
MCFCYLLNESLYIPQLLWGFIQSNAPTLSVIVTTLAVIVALLTPWLVNWLNNKPKKSELELENRSIVNQNGYLNGRLIIKNNGRFIARSVEIFIESIKFNGEIRENFFPVPLRWTHKNTAIRDIYPHQTAYLDLFVRERNDVKEYSLNIEAGYGIPSLSGLDCYGKSELFLRFYQESGQVEESVVEIDLNGPNDPKIKIIYFKVVK